MKIYFFEKSNLENDVQVCLDLLSAQVLDIEEEKKYSVILHNDPINGVDFVVRVIRSVFNYPTSKSIWLMLKAHFTGKSTLWVGSLHEAQEKKLQ